LPHVDQWAMGTIISRSQRYLHSLVKARPDLECADLFGEQFGEFVVYRVTDMSLIVITLTEHRYDSLTSAL
jgi:hypothetical protein